MKVPRSIVNLELPPLITDHWLLPRSLVFGLAKPPTHCLSDR